MNAALFTKSRHWRLNTGCATALLTFFLSLCCTTAFPQSSVFKRQSHAISSANNIFSWKVAARCFSTNESSNEETKNIVKFDKKSRRDFFISSSSFVFGGSVLSFTRYDDSAIAFPNKISNKYDDRPKRRGPQPKDLGVSTRKDMVGEEYLGLKPCGPAPNCFCSTDDIQDDPEHNIPSWKWPESRFGNDKSKAFLELQQVITSYKPGQSNIDGGGFQIVKFDPEAGYLYAQFESLKNGYIDDFELAYIVDNSNDGEKKRGEREVQVRSSSRVGYLDFGVNAKRINFVAKSLREKGWDAPGVDPETHQDYVIQNSTS